MNGIPAIGINLHTPGAEAFEDVEIDILSGKRIDLDILEYIPEIKDSPQAMEVIAELMAKLHEMEIDGNMTENISDLAENISQDNTSHLMAWLADVTAEGTDPEETKRAAELLEKLAE